MKWLPGMFIVLVVACALTTVQLLKKDARQETVVEAAISARTTESAHEPYAAIETTPETTADDGHSAPPANSSSESALPEGTWPLSPDLLVTLPDFDLANIETDDQGILKAQVLVDLILRSETDDAHLRLLLETLLDSFKQNGLLDDTAWTQAFQHFDRPTHLWIYVYLSDAHYESEQPLGHLSYIDGGRLVGGHPNEKPSVDVHIWPDVLRNRQEPPTVKFGLSEERRQRIYRESWLAERAAGNAAKAQYPQPDVGTPNLSEAMLVAYESESQRFDELHSELEAELCQQHGIDDETLDKIDFEGMKKMWLRPRWSKNAPVALRPDPKIRLPKHQLIGINKSNDGLEKAQIAAQIVLTEEATETQLRSLLLTLADTATNEWILRPALWGGPFEHYDWPTHVEIDLFLSEAHRACGLWIAQLLLIDRASLPGGYEDEPPSVDIVVKGLVLRNRHEKVGKRFGLAESRRKQVYWSYFEAFNPRVLQGMGEERIIEYGGSASASTALWIANYDQLDRLQSSWTVVETKIANRFNIRLEDLHSIVLEGVAKLWPQPPYQE